MISYAYDIMVKKQMKNITNTTEIKLDAYLLSGIQPTDILSVMKKS